MPLALSWQGKRQLVPALGPVVFCGPLGAHCSNEPRTRSCWVLRFWPGPGFSWSLGEALGVENGRKTTSFGQDKIDIVAMSVLGFIERLIFHNLFGRSEKILTTNHTIMFSEAQSSRSSLY